MIYDNGWKGKKEKQQPKPKVQPWDISLTYKKIIWPEQLKFPNLAEVHVNGNGF